MTEELVQVHSPEPAASRFAARVDDMLRINSSELFADLASGPMSYANCQERMYAHCGAFAQIGLTAGDRALIRSKNDSQVITLFLAMLRTGITPVIADAGATNAECADLARHCEIRAAFADQTFPVLPEVELVAIEADGLINSRLEGSHPTNFPKMPTAETALLVLTSGTTSTPKAVQLTYANLIAQLDIFEEVYGFGPGIRLLNLLPLHHVDGLIRGPLSALWFGGSVHRSRSFSMQAVPGILEEVASKRITHLISVPAMLRIIERAGADHPTAFNTPDFRFVLSSADMLDAALWRRFEERFSVSVANAYGLSEVVCDALFAGPESETRHIGTLGRAVGCSALLINDAGIEVAAGETGELVLSGPTVMQGYFNAPEVTGSVLKSGSFYTGDYMRINESGLFEFVGRKKTSIVSAGNTIHPEAATQVLSSMPGVLEAVAFGVPDEAMGERLVAAVVISPAHTISEADLAAHCRLSLSAERAPREYHIVDSLPRGASGKVKLEELAMLSRETAAPKLDVLSIAAKCFNVPVETLSMASNPYNTTGWDSLAHLQLIEAVEHAYKIQFSPMQIAQILCLGDLNDCLGEALKTA
ncbi:AMP-binding protein [Solirhodobacter olei]|uniref:AMP-binding protein n=1 Tax=Solirhodobacter olei TaxID=2493082 RepID=UPI000FD92687|nr:AMP-binding protein [Solirhodobacter olei]